MKVSKSYTRLLVKDWKACFLFYKDVIEFDIAVKDEEAGYAEFKAGEMRLAVSKRQEMAQMIHNAEKPAHAECQDTVVLVFTVHNLEEEYQRLTHKGVQFSVTPMNNPYYGMKTAYLRDPDGTLIGLYEYLV
ncbi:MAG: VOC family protein [Brasilonema octagenarum HA4186-MV1]|jgi:predicted enzyme related to lactoylglutathione lyase|uniref:Bleomycin resistance protein n=2 Tax=Brasilonema TaxID=383614 RepID=A0A856M810_9CYAN|nr:MULTISPECIES: VOC family protein [Brasilonema]MBW4628575.1 VOC family protein [Brasilonema octagenarum HA4186-MV1]NMF62647.1 bleomycin resistance protein [Brasilonema octagenarum UFV-OR1]QDL06872.1 bleomycin resistance protein [Brasilonema sennae CENA114]QDL13236.1 bleomycin resistance protein [Brasilonema octagenarum UFV-E1]